jgi:hypothetical protein
MEQKKDKRPQFYVLVILSSTKPPANESKEQILIQGSQICGSGSTTLVILQGVGQRARSNVPVTQL